MILVCITLGILTVVDLDSVILQATCMGNQMVMTGTRE